MKRFTSFLLALLMILSLASCAIQPEEITKEDSQEKEDAKKPSSSLLGEVKPIEGDSEQIQRADYAVSDKVLKGWKGEYSKQAFEDTVAKFVENEMTPVVFLEGNADSVVTFSVDCNAKKARVASAANIGIETEDCIDSDFDAKIENGMISIPVGWWYSEDSWVKDHPIWSYLIRVTDHKGGVHYYYFRVDYASDGGRYALKIENKDMLAQDANLQSEYGAGEIVTLKLSTVTERYYKVFVNGVSIPMAESDMEYSFFSFMMPDSPASVKIETVSVDIPDAP